MGLWPPSPEKVCEDFFLSEIHRHTVQLSVRDTSTTTNFYKGQSGPSGALNPGLKWTLRNLLKLSSAAPRPNVLIYEQLCGGHGLGGDRGHAAPNYKSTPGPFSAPCPARAAQPSLDVADYRSPL